MFYHKHLGCYAFRCLYIYISVQSFQQTYPVSVSKKTFVSVVPPFIILPDIHEVVGAKNSKRAAVTV